jgi:pilus assembly protein CpaB
MGRRTLLLIAALVVAGLGTALVFIYVNDVQNGVEEGETPVKVLVATQDVAPGTTAADASAAGAFEEKVVSLSSRAEGATNDISAISDQVALAPIFSGQQIQVQMFGSTASTSALNVPDGQIAISVRCGGARGRHPSRRPAARSRTPRSRGARARVIHGSGRAAACRRR